VNLPGLVQLLVGIIIIIGFGAGVFAWLAGAKDKANYESMQRAVEARDEEIAGLNLTVARHTKTIVAHETLIRTQGQTIATQAEEIATLRSERPSAEEIKHIRERLNQHDATVKAFIAKWENEHGD
jgi:uncharacterized protein HemX